MLFHHGTMPKCPIDQACVIPFRWTGGQSEFCLITSSSGRWVFPKGGVARGESIEQAGLKEAAEEAGLRGQIVGDPLGWHARRKRKRTLIVVTMMMTVQHCQATWREAARRERIWVDGETAASMLDTPCRQDALAAAMGRLQSWAATEAQ